MVHSMDNSSKNLMQQICPLCLSPLRDSKRGVFQSCSDCGLMIRMRAGEVDRLYRSGWHHPLENMNLTGGTTPSLAGNYSVELLRTLGLKNLEGKNILDFGGGRGEMTLALQAAGAKVVTVDPYSYMQLRDEGLTAVESLEQLGKGEVFDGAIAIDVIEHLTTPWDELRKIRDLLRMNGWLYLSTPNGSSLNSRLNRDNWREALNPSHLLLFTPASLEKSLQKAGFEHRQRLQWRVNYSENRLIQVKDWFLRSVGLDGVLRYLARV